MSEITYKVCDLCGHKDPLRYTGLVLGYGFSGGGWGRRQDHINWSGEVCDDCFNQAVEMHNQMCKSFLNREVSFYCVRVPKFIAQIVNIFFKDVVLERTLPTLNNPTEKQG